MVADAAVGGDVVGVDAVRPGEQGVVDVAVVAAAVAPPRSRAVNTSRPRASAQVRLTAVGRVAASSAETSSKRRPNAAASSLPPAAFQPSSPKPSTSP